MSQKDSVSRMVNERLAHCKVLLGEAKISDNKVSERAFIGAALLKLEQAVYFYCVELGLLPASLPQQAQQPLEGRIGLETLLSDDMPALTESSVSAQEMASLLNDETSWLRALIRAKTNEYAIIHRKSNTPSKGSIFSTEEVAESEAMNNTIALVDVDRGAQAGSKPQELGAVTSSDLESWTQIFQSLLERQRANSLEY